MLTIRCTMYSMASKTCTWMVVLYAKINCVCTIEYNFSFVTFRSYGIIIILHFYYFYIIQKLINYFAILIELNTLI